RVRCGAAVLYAFRLQLHDLGRAAERYRGPAVQLGRPDVGRSFGVRQWRPAGMGHHPRAAGNRVRDELWPEQVLDWHAAAAVLVVRGADGPVALVAAAGLYRHVG